MTGGRGGGVGEDLNKTRKKTILWTSIIDSLYTFNKDYATLQNVNAALISLIRLEASGMSRTGVLPTEAGEKGV